jgi:hypothetical protein
MSAQPAKSQNVIEVYELLLNAGTHRQPVAAIYDGLRRLLCPHVLGRKQAQLHALVYQVGGDSHSGLPVMPKRAGVWRYLAVEKLSQVELRAGEWRTQPRSSRQTCIDEVDFDVDDQPGADPQKGQ